MKRNPEAELTETATRFLVALSPELGSFVSSSVQPAYSIRSLVFAAFRLYQHEWSPAGGSSGTADIREWEWPFTTLSEGGAFKGNQPWTVLFRQALALHNA